MKWSRFLPTIVLSFLFTLGTLVFHLFVEDQKRHIGEVFQFQTERLTEQLFRTHLQGNIDRTPIPDFVVGFGIYGVRGQRVLFWGSTPPRLDANLSSLPPGGAIERTSEPHTYEYKKFLEPLRFPRPRTRFPSERPTIPRTEDQSQFYESGPEIPMPRANGPAANERALYLKFRDTEFESEAFAWDAARFLGPGLWAAILVSFGTLWSRNRRYVQTIQKNEELLQFTSASRTLSHELKNPLSAILLQTAILRKSNETPEVRVIEEEARRIARLVDRVQDFLKDSKGSPQTIDLWDFVSSLRTRFSVEIELEPPNSPGYSIAFDPDRLRSVLENLIKNACESGDEPCVELKISRPKLSIVRLEILDRGSGFSSESLRKAFDPFYTTKTQGSGIGLSIARGFVEAAGGSIALENRTGGGARVVLDFAAKGASS